jgi:uncharacterized protein involved in exopolysaccharide biosynthesis
VNPTDPERELDLFGLATALLRQARLTLGVPTALVTIVALFIFFAPRRYTAGVVFVPTGSAGAGSQIAGLAAQFGIGGGGAGASESPDFYADLVRSRAILQTVVTQQFRPGEGEPFDLIAAFEVDSTAPDLMREEAAEELRDRLSVSVAPKTGTVSVRVWTTDPDLSVQIVQRILDELDRYNRLGRQSQAREERQFLQGRMDSAQAELRAAQDRMQAFLQRNRDFAGSPQLQFQHQRIQQDLIVQQGLYTSLVQAFEQARMEEVRGTPVITIVQPPLRPARPDARRLVVRVFMTGVLGLFLGAALAVAAESLARRRRETPEQVAEVVSLWRTLWERLLSWLPGRRADRGAAS